MASFVLACYFNVKEHHKRGIHGHEMLSLESAVPIEGPELTKLAARALRESMQGRSRGWSELSFLAQGWGAIYGCREELRSWQSLSTLSQDKITLDSEKDTIRKRERKQSSSDHLICRCCCFSIIMAKWPERIK